MKRWEYLTLKAEKDRPEDEDEDASGRWLLHEFDLDLDECGSEGWELVSCGYNTDSDPVTAVFKRELEE